VSRDEGFAVMDVSTSWLLDDKFTKLARDYPRLLMWGVVAYASTKAASWRHGKRMTVGDSLPAWLHYDPDGMGALMAVRLIDRTGRVPVKTWHAWFGRASSRRQNSRERWARANDKRAKHDESEHDLPRGSGAVTASTVRPFLTTVPTVPPEGSTGRDGSNGAAATGPVDPR